MYSSTLRLFLSRSWGQIKLIHVGDGISPVWVFPIGECPEKGLMKRAWLWETKSSLFPLWVQISTGSGNQGNTLLAVFMEVGVSYLLSHGSTSGVNLHFRGY